MKKMQILSIKISRNPNKVFITISNGLFIPLFIDDLVTLKLKSHQEIDKKELDKILQTSLAYLFKEYALRQISISPKTVYLLTIKLKNYVNKIYYKYKFPPIHNTDELIKNCISLLKSKNLLKETDFIESFINKNKYKSKIEIKYLLSQQGISNDLIQRVIPKINDKEKIRKLINKKKYNTQKLSDYNSKLKLTRYLICKGFSQSDIKSVIDDLINSR